MPTEPITAEDVYINGNAYRATDPAWLGLDFSEATLVSDGRITINNVLSVPWIHPENRARNVQWGSKYRVRPRNPLAQFKNIDGQWHMVTE